MKMAVAVGLILVGCSTDQAATVTARLFGSEQVPVLVVDPNSPDPVLITLRDGRGVFPLTTRDLGTEDTMQLSSTFRCDLYYIAGGSHASVEDARKSAGLCRTLP